MTRRVYYINVFNRELFKRLRFRILIKFEPERGLVVHLVVGIHVANVAVADQGHVTKLIF